MQNGFEEVGNVFRIGHPHDANCFVSSKLFSLALCSAVNQKAIFSRTDGLHFWQNRMSRCLQLFLIRPYLPNYIRLVIGCDIIISRVAKATVPITNYILPRI
jgi:hypothetical protein